MRRLGHLSCAFLALPVLWALVGCGGGGEQVPSPPERAPAEVVVSVSPTTTSVSTRGTLQFTATVTGTTVTAVTWSISGCSLIDCGAITASGLYTAPSSIALQTSISVTAISQADSTKSGTAIVQLMPCELATPRPASTQTKSRLGAYYFDGWSGPLTNFHFDGLVNGPYQNREPLSGWLDNTPCVVEQQFAWAHSFGINFFVFLWYHDATNYEDDNLNNALQITGTLPDRHGMQFAIMYVNHDPFAVQPTDWDAAMDEWIGYLKDPDYLLVNGKPLLIVYDMDAMRRAFGTSSGVEDAFSQLRVKAQENGLPGVYVVGGVFAGYDQSVGGGSFPDLSVAVTEGYDAVSLYNWSFGTVRGQQPYSVLATAGEWVWQQASTSPLPFIPVVMAGWDARPWGNTTLWFTRTPTDVAGAVSSAINWAELNPQVRPEPSTTPPIVLIEAWNELGEGGYIVPTIEDGTTYGDSLADVLKPR